MTIVPSALLTRKMQFRSLGMIEITGTFISGILGVGAAVMGAGYWALVIQAVSLEAICLFLVLYVNGLPDLSWSATAARRLWSFSSRIMGADLVNYASGNIDKLLVARFLGATALGLYSLAFRVLQLTLAVCGQVGRVVLPTFARLQDDRERLARAFLAVTESVSLALFPAMTLTILLAPIGVPAVLGEAWADAVVPLQLLAAMTIPCILLSFMGPLTVAVGRADWEFRFSVVGMIAALVSFPVGLQWGIIGVAASYLIMISVLYAIRLAITQRLIPISARGYLPRLGAGLGLFHCAWCRVVAHGGLAPGCNERTGAGYACVGDRRGSLCGRSQGRMARRLPSSARLRSPSRTRRTNVSDGRCSESTTLQFSKDLVWMASQFY